MGKIHGNQGPEVLAEENPEPGIRGYSESTSSLIGALIRIAAFVTP